MAPAVVSAQAITTIEVERSKPFTGEIKVQDLRVPVKSVVEANVEASVEANPDDLGPKRDIIIFSDFDGTIFMQDTGHILFDAFGCGPTRREELDEEIKNGVRSFREVSEEMWGSLKIPFDDGFEVMQTALEIDPDFRDFHAFCLRNHIPFNVISAGLKPVLRRVLDLFLGPKESKFIDIIANDATIPTGDTIGAKWAPIWRHNTPLGHDKAASIQEYRTIASSESEDGSCPMIIFVGDGVSDLAAAGEADVLFARAGLRLEEYCIQNKIPHFPYNTFADIKREIIKITKEDQKATKGQGKPKVYNPRANIWRKAAKPKTVPRFVRIASKDDKMRLWPETFTVKDPNHNESKPTDPSAPTAPSAQPTPEP